MATASGGRPRHSASACACASDFSLFSFSSFVTDQLHPTFEIFGPEELEVVLKPFGKANVGIVA